MDVSDYRILEFIYLTLEKTKLERQQMSPFQFRRLIIEALQSRQYTVRAEEVSERMFNVNRLVILFFPYDIERDDAIRKYLLEILTQRPDHIRVAYSIRNGGYACIFRIEKPEN
ncbi:MAG: hypothetical protein IJI57_01520 [Flexilinea sp.]|nr:hypothetical protein [Flexilinea sp.]